MNTREIRGHLLIAGFNIKEVADAIGVSSSAIIYTINGHSPSLRISQFIADKIGKPLEEVFPRYKTK